MADTQKQLTPDPIPVAKQLLRDMADVVGNPGDDPNLKLMAENARRTADAMEDLVLDTSEPEPTHPSVSPGGDTSEYRTTQFNQRLGAFLALVVAPVLLAVPTIFPNLDATLLGIAALTNVAVGGLVAFFSGKSYATGRVELKLNADKGTHVRELLGRFAEGMEAAIPILTQLTGHGVAKPPSVIPPLGAPLGVPFPPSVIPTAATIAASPNEDVLAEFITRDLEAMHARNAKVTPEALSRIENALSALRKNVAPIAAALLAVLSVPAFASEAPTEVNARRETVLEALKGRAAAPQSSIAPTPVPTPDDHVATSAEPTEPASFFTIGTLFGVSLKTEGPNAAHPAAFALPSFKFGEWRGHDFSIIVPAGYTGRDPAAGAGITMGLTGSHKIFEAGLAAAVVWNFADGKDTAGPRGVIGVYVAPKLRE